MLFESENNFADIDEISRISKKIIPHDEGFFYCEIFLHGAIAESVPTIFGKIFSTLP